MKISSQTRLTLFFTGLFATILMLSFGILTYQINKNLHQEFQLELVHDGRIFAELFKEELKLNALNELSEEIDELNIELLILDSNQKTVVISKGWNKLGITINKEILTRIKIHPLSIEKTISGTRYSLFNRLVHVPSYGIYSMHIVRSQNSIHTTTKRLIYWILILTPFMLTLSAIAGFLFSRRTLQVEKNAFDQLEKFTADASHELRIPLTSLRGNLEVALRKDRTKEEYRETIENALEEAEHLSQLTQNLLLLARSESNRLKLDIQDTNPDQFLENIIQHFNTLPNEKNIRLSHTPGQKISVHIDPERVRQLLFILIDNAIKYGIPNGTINLSMESTDNETIIKVSDNGIGISKEEQTKVFDRFYRVDKARSRDQGGVGLGLSIAQWIVKQHKGRIELESELGKGSVFTIFLPNPL